MTKKCEISFLVLSIKCVISCMNFFELSLFRVCSPNNFAIVFLKVVAFVLKMYRLCS